MITKVHAETPAEPVEEEEPVDPKPAIEKGESNLWQLYTTVRRLELVQNKIKGVNYPIGPFLFCLFLSLFILFHTDWGHVLRDFLSQLGCVEWNSYF